MCLAWKVMITTNLNKTPHALCIDVTNSPIVYSSQRFRLTIHSHPVDKGIHLQGTDGGERGWGFWGDFTSEILLRRGGKVQRRPLGCHGNPEEHHWAVQGKHLETEQRWCRGKLRCFTVNILSVKRKLIRVFLGNMCTKLLYSHFSEQK